MNAFHNSLVFAHDNQLGLVIVAIVVQAIVLYGTAQTFAKAGQPRWGVLIPIYNKFLWLDIAQRSRWWFVLLLIPGVSVLVSILVSIGIAKAFGKGTGFGFGLAFFGFIFYPILGFGDAVYRPIAKLSAVTKKQFEGLGVSLVNNYLGRGSNVAFGRGSKIGKDHLAALIPIVINELYLSRTTIGDDSLAHFEAMRHLRVLDLSHTNVSRDGIQRLKDALPEAEIIG